MCSATKYADVEYYYTKGNLTTLEIYIDNNFYEIYSNRAPTK